MLPDVNTELTELEVTTQPSKTYNLDTVRNRIGVMIDGREAIMQAVKKILYTERYANVIYGSNYGVELYRLFGKDLEFVVGDLEATITEALLTDDRIESISNFQIGRSSIDSVIASFTVNSIYGNIPMQAEVAI